MFTIERVGFPKSAQVLATTQFSDMAEIMARAAADYWWRTDSLSGTLREDGDTFIVIKRDGEPYGQITLRRDQPIWRFEQHARRSD